MAGVKGRSGKGLAKPWTDALRVATHRKEGDKVVLNKIAEACIAAAIAGDMTAIKEIGDRLDGRPAQEQTLNINDKREHTDWSIAELDAIISHARNGGDRAEAPPAGPAGTDQVH